MRVFAALGVICMHAEPLVPGRLAVDTPLSMTLAWCIQVLSLFAVPYFFIVSGHFFGNEARASSPLVAFRRLAARLVPMFLFWDLFFALAPTPYAAGRFGFFPAIWRNLGFLLRDLRDNPLKVLYDGSSIQLWFLPACIIAAGLATLFLSMKRPTAMLVLGVALFLIGLLGQAWGEALDFLVSRRFGINTRLGPYFGAPLFFLGVWSSEHAVPRRELSVLVAAGGLGLLFLEAWFLMRLGAHLGHYYCSSIPLALGLLWLTLSAPNMFGRAILPKLGRLTPGVFLLHVYVLTMFEQFCFVYFEYAAFQLSLPVLLFALSAAVTLVLRHIPWLRRTV